MPNSTCACCGKLSEPHKTVNCFVCNKAFKMECVNISSAEIRRINSRSGMSWTCKNCLELGNDFASLKSVIVSLQDEIKALKITIRDSNPSASTPLVQTEMIIQEICEREKRKNNIIVYGCKESDCRSNKEQIVLDEALVRDVCEELHVVDDNLKVFRLGKFDQTKTERNRPIKVSFSNESNVIKVLRGLPKLGKITRFSGISIYRDRTPMQAQLHKDIKAELSQRLDNGESNLQIKYKKGIPTIVSTTKN